MDESIGPEIPEFAFANLYPALMSSFAIILAGYIAARLNVITNATAQGFHTYVGKFALPSLIFLSLAEIKWDTVNWMFLLAMLISKAIVFFAVMFVSFVVVRPINFGIGGIFAIFCTQSNDFAFGCPIVGALYAQNHPEYLAYIYLMAPISLAILNPIAYILMDIQNLRNKDENEIIESEDRSKSKRKVSMEKFCVIYEAVKSILINPILVMTMFGILASVTIKNGLPTFVISILKSLGDSFAATALFLLGVSMLNDDEHSKSGILMPAILIIVKLLVLPLVTHQTVNIMDAGGNFNETTDLSTFGFLYGTFPSAPGVFTIATEYGIGVNLIASSMVFCTFISAPLMFLSAKMISITDLSVHECIVEYEAIAFHVSLIAIFAAFFILLLFIITKKITRLPHRATCCLLLSQIIASCGIFLWSIVEEQNDLIRHLQFYFFTIGENSTRLWTAILAIILLLMSTRGLCFVQKIWLYFVFIGFALPFLITAILSMTDNILMREKQYQILQFQFSSMQAIISAAILVMCFIVTIGCLVLYRRYCGMLKKSIQTNENSPKHVDSNMVFIIDTLRKRRMTLVENDEISNFSEREIYGSNESGFGSETYQFENVMLSCDKCQSFIQEYQTNEALEPIEFDDDVDLFQAKQHTVLLVLLVCSMFVSFALTMWTVFTEGMSGIYIGISFLEAFLNFGQSLMVFACLVCNTSEVYTIIVNFLRRKFCEKNSHSEIAWDDLPDDTKIICKQFVTFHLKQCCAVITRDKRWRMKIYNQVFYGTEFVDYLTEAVIFAAFLDFTAGSHERHHEHLEEELMLLEEEERHAIRVIKESIRIAEDHGDYEVKHRLHHKLSRVKAKYHRRREELLRGYEYSYRY
ncbi:hypothetical protein PVAND_013277 [Polypedilum vanderplanki]|uniref:Integral membrane protein n=1 Tax=Polypedilum vanderplanki TaxID=319348 RepID=A0A9J6CPZ6_POLVA|nr:hypothetical protein PVAND_013277 [Polypedilum vanderplanki]